MPEPDAFDVSSPDAATVSVVPAADRSSGAASVVATSTALAGLQQQLARMHRAVDALTETRDAARTLIEVVAKAGASLAAAGEASDAVAEKMHEVARAVEALDLQARLEALSEQVQAMREAASEVVVQSKATSETLGKTLQTGLEQQQASIDQWTARVDSSVNDMLSQIETGIQRAGSELAGTLKEDFRARDEQLARTLAAQTAGLEDGIESTRQLSGAAVGLLEKVHELQQRSGVELAGTLRDRTDLVVSELRGTQAQARADLGELRKHTAEMERKLVHEVVRTRRRMTLFAFVFLLLFLGAAAAGYLLLK